MQRALSSVGFAMAIVAIAPAYAEQYEQAPPEVVPDTSVVAPKALDLDFGGGGDDPPAGAPCGIDGGIGRRAGACSASMARDERFLAVPLAFERSPTRTTSFTRGFGDGIEQDALPAFHPARRCYTSGEREDRSPWRPVGGIPIVQEVGELVFFSREGNRPGEVYTNSITRRVSSGRTVNGRLTCPV